MLRLIDSSLNKFTMYKLTMYYLIALVLGAVALSIAKVISYNPLDILINAFVAFFLSYFVNKIFAGFFKAVTNNESAYISGLILMLIIPISFPRNIFFLIAACVLAMASKYLATIEKQHIFNPAAVSVLAFSLISDHIATWWIGTPAMLPFVIVGGILLARRIQRMQMVLTFFATFFIVTGLFAIFQGGVESILNVWKAGTFHTALFFLGFVMLTEPLTSPSTEKYRQWYAILVAILFASPNLKLFGLALAPEVALCIGNVFSYIVNPKYRLVLPFVRGTFFANTGVFAFAPSMPIKFIPGQYMEWTLPHPKTDNRGNRRYFSIASSPTEKEIILTVKFYNPSSSYKKKLQTLKPGDSIIAASLSGDFVLPKNLSNPLVFIAGGVGIAPFRSMIKYIIDNKLSVNIVLFYANRTADEIAFNDVFTEAENYGVKTIYTLTDQAKVPANWLGEKDYVTPGLIQKYVTDYKNSLYYLSGPQLMIESYETMLMDMKISNKQIKHDFFPGYSET